MKGRFNSVKKISAKRTKSSVARSTNEFNLTFGLRLHKLRGGLSLRQFARLLSHAYQQNSNSNKTFSGQYIHRVEKGNRASDELIKALHYYLGIDEEELRLVAGRPSIRVLRQMAANPKELLRQLSIRDNHFKIGVAEFIGAAHIYAIHNIQRPISKNSYECQAYETGQEALEQMLAGNVHFATVTKRVLDNKQKEDSKIYSKIVRVLDFITMRGDLYALYETKEALQKTDKSYAFLEGSAGADAAQEYIDDHKVLRITLKPLKSTGEITEAIVGRDIQGFFGWSPLDQKVNWQIKRKNLRQSTQSRLLVTEKARIEAGPDRGPILYLVATADFLATHDPSIVRDLVLRIVVAREELNKKDAGYNFVEIFKPYMQYIEYVPNESLHLLKFDANISSVGLEYMLRDLTHSTIGVGD